MSTSDIMILNFFEVLNFSFWLIVYIFKDMPRT